jgi:protein gp37
MKDSKISWTHHTFNPWRGCEKVSPACDNCYAEVWAKRTGKDIWGKDKPREEASEDYWRQPEKWNREAAQAGERRRVFCLSLADMFEARHDLSPLRTRLYGVIERTEWLDYLLLTKRPGNAPDMVPAHWLKQPRANVWFGTTVEHPDYLGRLDELMEIPAIVRFVSAEPLLAPIKGIGRHLRAREGAMAAGIHWVIVGGESGGHARPMQPSWARQIRDLCNEAHVAFFFKQWGAWAPVKHYSIDNEWSFVNDGGVQVVRRKREALVGDGDGGLMAKVGAGLAGHVLDGKIWTELPNTSQGGTVAAQHRMEYR